MQWRWPQGKAAAIVRLAGAGGADGKWVKLAVDRTDCQGPRRMIDLYYWPTPNGHKITIFLEEAQLPYRILPINIARGEQFRPDFLEIAPNNRMPAIVDSEPTDGTGPLSVFESGAILLYLGEKTGRFLPTKVRARYAVVQWLFWQMAGLGPMAGQNHHFSNYAPEKLPYAI